MSCNIWTSFVNPTKVHGIIGGIGCTKEITEKANSEGILCVIPSDGIYKIQPPTSGLKNFYNSSSSYSSASSSSSAAAAAAAADILTPLSNVEITEEELYDTIGNLIDDD